MQLVFLSGYGISLSEHSPKKMANVGASKRLTVATDKLSDGFSAIVILQRSGIPKFLAVFHALHGEKSCVDTYTSHPCLLCQGRLAGRKHRYQPAKKVVCRQHDLSAKYRLPSLIKYTGFQKSKQNNAVVLIRNVDLQFIGISFQFRGIHRFDFGREGTERARLFGTHPVADTVCAL